MAAKKRRGLTALATEKEMTNDPDEAIAIPEARREKDAAVEADRNRPNLF